MIPGITGALFPSRYLADQLAADAGTRLSDPALVVAHRQLTIWWRRVAAECGPATGIRACFDRIAMPLAAILRFRATGVTFANDHARVRLDTPDGTPVGLLIARWSERAPATWRDAVSHARSIDADWCFLLAPPYLALVATRSGASRRAVEFRFPESIERPDALAALWTIARAAAFDAGGSHVAPVDALVRAGAAFQDRVREDLQLGVHEALASITPVLPPGDARVDEALTLVYRVLFLLFVESRDLVPCRHPIYRGTYAIAALARDALGPPPARGLWDGLGAITRLLRTGCRVDDLIVRPFNGRLFARASAPTLERASASRRPGRQAAARDAAIAGAIIALSTRASRTGRDTITYADLGVEQLGAVYERVLDLDPRDESSPESKARPAGGSRRHSARRKQTGTFYTPRALTELVVRKTLHPLVTCASADAILDLRVVDPAMGSGAFLVAACQYLASAYERALVEEGRLADRDIDDVARADMRRLVAQRCLYGVDRNPVAVQLARLSLWLATLAHGKPLSFLDHRLRAGNSLVGATPDDLRRVTDRRRVEALPLFADDALEWPVSRVVGPLAALAQRADDTVGDVRAKESAWSQLSGDASPLSAWRHAADLWCARWFWPEGAPPSAAETRATIDALLRRDLTIGAGHLARHLAGAAGARAQHGFFHWPLECADVFYDERGHPKARPGFDAVIGNPPWEMLRRDEAGSDTRNGNTQGQLVRFIRESGLYPACDRGHVNLYQPFVERALDLARTDGRVGLILPWGLATDDGAAALRSRLFDRANTHEIVGLDNAAGLFPIHRGLRFLVVITSPGGKTRDIRARFGLKTAAEVESLGDDLLEDPEATRGLRLTPPWLATLSGPARRIPDVRRLCDLDLLDTLARRFPPFGNDAGWGAQFGRELNATEDRPHFEPQGGSRGLPVLEGKHIQPFHVDVSHVQHRIALTAAAALLPDRRFELARLGYRDVSGVSNRFPLIAAVIPPNTVTTHTLFCLRTPLVEPMQHFLCGVLNSWVVNLLVRMLMGGHVTTGLVEGLPMPPWTGTPLERRIARLARRIATGGPTPSHLASAALQAAAARHFGLDAAAFGRVIDAFPLVDATERTALLQAFLRGEAV